MRALFMGTPTFAIPSLLALASLPDIEVVGVVTRWDKPSGRSTSPRPPPVKVAAHERGLPVLQPGSLRRATALTLLRDQAPDVIIVAAFGQILPPEILQLPRHGCLNVHASLLPRYRGASPITAVLLDGARQTGTTIMLLDEGLDTGAILAQEAIPIAADDTTATLTARLAAQGAALLADTLPRWLAGAITPRPQDETQATMTRLIRKDDGIIDWHLPAIALARRIRAYTPWPSTTTNWKGQPLKVIAGHVADDAEYARFTQTADALPEPGTVLVSGRGQTMLVGVSCGAQSVLVLDMLQLAGKRALPAPDVIRGYPPLAGTILPTTA